MVYTVDEVSAELGIPRPTVYRYLKEYSIPFSRRSGRIFVPEASIERIRTVRELHDEGFGTEAVRVRLRQGGGTDLRAVSERLDKLTDLLENSRSAEPRVQVEPAHASPTAYALRVVLARQSVLISAVSNLSEMMGDLMAANGLPRRTVLDYPEATGRDHPYVLPARNRRSLAPAERRPAPYEAPGETPQQQASPLPPDISHDKFGTLARRRRKTIAAVLLVLALAAVLTWQALR